MEFDQEFERDFMRRTLTLVKEYHGPYDATLLLNCLLGLLIVPKEASLKKIPPDPVAELKKWGISPRSIRSFGRKSPRNQHPETLQDVVHRLRNAVAHFRFRPIHDHHVVKKFAFDDANGFEAEIAIGEMREFVERLAHYLEQQY